MNDYFSFSSRAPSLSHSPPFLPPSLPTSSSSSKAASLASMSGSTKSTTFLPSQISGMASHFQEGSSNKYSLRMS